MIAVLDHRSRPEQRYPHLHIAPLSIPMPLTSLAETCHSAALVVPWILAPHCPLPDEWPTRVNGLSPVIRAGGGKPLTPSWHTPGTSPAQSPPRMCGPPDVNAVNADFNAVWQTQLDRRRDALAPHWNARTRTVVGKRDWQAIWASWHFITQNLHKAGDKHIKKMNRLRRVKASVMLKGTWVCVLWCRSDGRVYVGQMGARGSKRSVTNG